MTIIRLFHLILLFGVCCSQTHMYAQEINLKKVDFKDAVSSTSVQRVFQDKEGYIWMGTLDGLYRYDGYRTLVFRSDFNNPNLLTNNNITSIAEDGQNNIWIGTKKGINILDKKSYQIRAFENEEIAGLDIFSIIVSSDGLIWVGAGNRLYCFSNYEQKEGYSVTEFSSSVNSIYEDYYGDIWVTVWNRGLHKYNKENNSFDSFPPVGGGNNPFRIYQDKQKRYWVGTWGNGLYRFDPQGNKESMYTLVQNVDTDQACFSIVEDDYFGYLWVMTFLGLKVLKVDENNEIEEVKTDVFKQTNNIFSEIIKDKKGLLWIGAFGDGLLNINFEQTPIVNYKFEEIKKRLGVTANITKIYEDSEGDLWFNQNRYGVGIYFPKEDKVKLYQDFPNLRNEPTISWECAININKSDTIWLGNAFRTGIHILKKNGEDIRHIGHINLSDISSNPGAPTIFFQDSRKNLWIGTSQSLFIKEHNESMPKLVKGSIGQINSIVEDSKGSIWIGCSNSGLHCIPFSLDAQFDELDIKNYSEKYENIIKSNHIQSIATDQDGRVWIGTQEGRILVYDNRSNTFIDYTHKCGMLGNTIFDIIVDNLGKIWITTQQHLIEFDPANEAFLVHSNSDRLLVNSFMKGSFFKSQISNNIYFGGNQGISSVEASNKLSKLPAKAKAFITDIKINNISVFHDNDNSKFDPLRDILELSPEDKNIEIDFSSLNYVYPENIHYSYKLVGVDEDWVLPVNNRQFASYNQLKRGTYKFQIKASDENRIWSDNITTLTIVKHPAFYETWWAYTFYSIVILLMVFGILRFYTNRLKLKNDLKIVQIEKEKTEELTQTKLRYFTNVSHDFLTPLTILSCMIDDIEISSDKKIVQLDTMRLNINRLRRLLQQILDIRKIENSSMKLKITKGDISLFIEDLYQNHFTPLIKNKNIDFNFTSEPPHIIGYFDADKIDKIVFNLLSNAFKYTPDNGTIGINMNVEEQERALLVLKVSDSGIGISPEDINNIFTRFFHNKNTDLSRTNGIGLSLTKDLVNLHKGTITVDSELNKGTVFTVKLPIDKDSYGNTEITEAEAMITEESSISEDTRLKENIDNSVRLLLVEDNEELLNTVSKILAKQYLVVKAKNGVEALQEIEKSQIDIIISDVMMPEMDGLELCRIVKGNIETSHIPILLLTAKNSTEDRIECYNVGADGYISKPFDIKLLQARINNFLSYKQKQQQKFKQDPELEISTLNYTSLDEEFLKNVVKLIEDNLSEPDFDNEAFAQQLNMSKSTLYRKIKTITGLSPIELIKNIRMKHASTMLRQQYMTIAEVAYATGFSDPKHFSHMFKAEFNISPSEYKKEHNKNS